MTPEPQTYMLDALELDSGAVLSRIPLVYTTYGTLNAARTNAVVMPTYYSGTHAANEPWIGPGLPLDTDRLFVVVPNMFGNGVSFSPSNADTSSATTHLAGPGFPQLSVADNVRAQRALLFQHLGVEYVALAVGWSMGAMQSYEWARAEPGRVGAILPICGTARCGELNSAFLSGVRAALEADATFAAGHYREPPLRGLGAFGRVYASWAYSDVFYRDRAYTTLGLSSREELFDDWAADHQTWDANDLLAMLDTWRNAAFDRPGSFDENMRSITAKTIVMPDELDMYFTLTDIERDASLIAGAEVRPLASGWGHMGGKPGLLADVTARITEAVNALLSV